MRKITVALVTAGVMLAVLTTDGCVRRRAIRKTVLWNGKDFAGWKLFVPDESVDVHQVWSVKNGVIHCKGKPNGYMRTEADYSNYKLHVEWRWAEKPTNSGVLLHMSGPDKVWPKSVECQLMHKNAGDFWLIGGTAVTVGGKTTESTGKPTRVRKKEDSSEKPVGEWNTYEILCKGDTIRCHVNGVLQNEGTGASETSGRICLQSEGSPIEFRNIYIESLD
jgi:hypothetical protein